MTKRLYKLLSYTSNIAVMCIMLSRKKSAKHQIFKFKTHLEGRASVFTSVTDVLQSILTNSRQRADAQKSNTHSAWIVLLLLRFPVKKAEWCWLVTNPARMRLLRAWTRFHWNALRDAASTGLHSTRAASYCCEWLHAVVWALNSSLVWGL